MRQLRALIICSVISLACNNGTNDEMPPPDPDLATAPLGGEYVGMGWLDRDTCNGYDKETEADQEYFEPFFIEVKLYPQNADHSNLTFSVGEIYLNDVAPTPKLENSRLFYEFNHEAWENSFFSVIAINLTGVIEAGEMNVDLLQGVYLGTKESPGEKSCEVNYKLHTQKILNYPYVKP